MFVPWEDENLNATDFIPQVLHSSNFGHSQKSESAKLFSSCLQTVLR